MSATPQFIAAAICLILDESELGAFRTSFLSCYHNDKSLNGVLLEVVKEDVDCLTTSLSEKRSSRVGTRVHSWEARMGAQAPSRNRSFVVLFVFLLFVFHLLSIFFVLICRQCVACLHRHQVAKRNRFKIYTRSKGLHQQTLSIDFGMPHQIGYTSKTRWGMAGNTVNGDQR